MKCEFIDNWHESLIWCPSQLFRRARCGSHIFTLYLRWRYRDPWQFYIALGDMLSKDEKWELATDDLFEIYGIYIESDRYKEAEEKAEELFIQIVDKIINSIEKTKNRQENAR